MFIWWRAECITIAKESKYDKLGIVIFLIGFKLVKLSTEINREDKRR